MRYLNYKKRYWLAQFLIIATVLTGGCRYDKEELLYPGNNPPNNCAAIPASFKTEVLPLITSKCAISGCHDATASGGQVFQNYNQISAAKDRIYIRAVIQKTMPATGFLTATEINTLSCWIAGGAINN